MALKFLTISLSSPLKPLELSLLLLKDLPTLVVAAAGVVVAAILAGAAKEAAMVVIITNVIAIALTVTTIAPRAQP